MLIGQKITHTSTKGGATLKVTEHTMKGFHTEVDLRDHPKLLDFFEDIQKDHHKYLQGIKRTLKQIKKKYDLNEKENQSLNDIIFSIEKQIKDEKETVKKARKGI